MELHTIPPGYIPASGSCTLTVESFLNELMEAIEAGSEGALRKRYQELHILLLDDVQFFTGQNEAQEILLRLLDGMNKSGGQVVLASDRPPAEINGLDARLLTRFSGGLIVDIAVPEYETKVAILRKKAEERDQTFEAGVAEALAKHALHQRPRASGGAEQDSRHPGTGGAPGGKRTRAKLWRGSRKRRRAKARSTASFPKRWRTTWRGRRSLGGGCSGKRWRSSRRTGTQARAYANYSNPTSLPGPPSGGRPISQRYRPTPSG